MVYNECDQLTSWPGMYAYEYDLAGNLIRTRARDSQGPVAAEYTYTVDGLLATATCGGTTTLTNTWNAMGNRVGLTVGSESYSSRLRTPRPSRPPYEKGGCTLSAAA